MNKDSKSSDFKNKIIEEMDSIAQAMHNSKIGQYRGGGDFNNLKTYSAFLSAKSNEELLKSNEELRKSTKTYYKWIIGLSVLNLVFFFINIHLIFRT